jgi:hypothetical protein
MSEYSGSQEWRYDQGPQGESQGPQRLDQQKEDPGETQEIEQQKQSQDD